MPFLFQAEQKNMPASTNTGFIAVERPRVYGPGVIVLLTLFGISIVAWALLFSFRVKVLSDTELIRRETDDLERTRNKQLEGQIIAFEKRVSAFSKIFRSHIHLSKVFPALGDVTLPTVFYDSLSVTFGTDDISVSGKSEKAEVVRAEVSGSAPALLDLARQMIAYRQHPQILKGEVTGFSLGKESDQRVMFSASLLFDKKLILAP